MNSFEDLCIKYKNQKISCIIPGGNGGDGLIYVGSRSILKKYSIDYKESIFKKFDTTDNWSKILFIYGCGGYCRSFNNFTKLITDDLLNSFEKVYILPSSFECSYDVISNWLMANPIIIVIIFSIILLLKGLALYRAARKESMVWFWVLLIFNTLGILPLLYLIFSRRE